MKPHEWKAVVTMFVIVGLFIFLAFTSGGQL